MSQHHHEHEHENCCHSHGEYEHEHCCHRHDEHEHGCGCHHHEHEGNRNVMYARLAVGAVLTVLGAVLPIPGYLLLIPYAVLGYDVLFSSVKNILHGEFFDEEFLMSIATIGALILSKYTEACAVMFFYQTGELLSDITADKCRTSIKNMFDFAPDSARRITETGFETVSPDELKVNDRIAVFAGEKIPCDGFVYSGDSYADTSSLTGESMPVHISDGAKVLGGAINLDSPINVRITEEYKNSSVAKVVRMLEEASKNKSKSEKFITAFAKRYTPAVVLIAVLSAIILPFLPGFDVKSGIYTALMFLVISCPCSLVISIPLTLFAGIGRAAKNKILFKGNNSLESLYKIKNFAFDKTGTLTSGHFGVENTTLSEEDFALLAQTERFSNHPLAAVIASYAKEPYQDAAGITSYHGALLPEDKTRYAEELKENSPLAYVGDGINDAPVLSLADIGISMGGAGSDIAIANSDIILLDDDLKSLETSIDISRKTMRIVYQNIILSLGIKAVVMLLGFLNMSSMALAIFADVGAMVITVLNSIRAMK